MSSELVRSARVLRAALVEFRPEQHPGDDCAVLVEELAALEKVCAAARVRAAAHAGSCGAHKERGFADVSDWLARASGSTASSAKAALDTAAALEDLPGAKAALESGELSLAQAKELVRTEAECPGSAADLLDVAKQNSLKTLREQARDRRVRSIDPEELHALQHAAMHARHWTNKLGNTVCTVELPPDSAFPSPPASTPKPTASGDSTAAPVTAGAKPTPTNAAMPPAPVPARPAPAHWSMAIPETAWCAGDLRWRPRRSCG